MILVSSYQYYAVIGQLLSILRCDWCRISLQLPEQEAASSTIVVFKSFENLGCIINGQQSCHTPNYDEQRQVRAVSSVTVVVY